MYRVMPSRSHRSRSSWNTALLLSLTSSLGEPRFMRYEPWGRMSPECMPLSARAALNLATVSSVSGFAFHWRCDLRNSAMDWAPMAAALAKAFSMPPAAETCAPG